MTESRVANNWEQGSNNIAQADRLPENFARRITNAEPTPGGKLVMRAGYEMVHAGTDIRGALALGTKILIADGASLVEFDTETNSSQVLRTIATTGHFVGDVLDNILYFCTENECLKYDGHEVTQWGVPDVRYQPTVTVGSTGGLVAGLYNVAVTFSDASGMEGGTDNPMLLTVPANGSLTVDMPEPPEGCTVNLYVGNAQTKTLYFQGVRSTAGTMFISLARSDTKRLATALLRAPEPGHLVVAHNGVLCIAKDHVLWLTTPLRPHLVSRAKRFYQYAERIGAVMSGDVLFVSADKSYAISDVETGTPRQDIVLEFPAIPGTAVVLPDTRVAWMTQYGQAVSNGASLQLINLENYVVGEQQSGVAGVVENNGNQLIVTAARGGRGPGGLAASDYFFGEVLNR